MTGGRSPQTHEEKKEVNRRLRAAAFYSLVAKVYPPAIAFLKVIGVLEDGEGKQCGQFTVEEFRENEPSARAYLAGKMRSTGSKSPWMSTIRAV